MLKAIFDRTTTNPLREAIRAMLPPMQAIAGLSFFINLLVFTPSLYIEGNFDRVLTSRNLVTWAFMTAIMVLLVVTHGYLSTLRQRMLVRVGVAFDDDVSPRLFHAVHRSTLNGSRHGGINPVQAMRDLDVLRDNLSGRLVSSAVDLLFVPLFIAVMFVVHPLIGLTLVVVLAAVVASGFAVNLAAAHPTLRATAAGVHAADYATAMLRNGEVIHALGMLGRLRTRWKKVRDAGLIWQAEAADAGTLPGIILAALTFGGTMVVTGATVVLIVNNEVSAGVLFGAMIITGKAISPATTIAKNWKSYVSADYAFHRIDRIFSELPNLPERMPLPRPNGRLVLENVTACAPGSSRPVLRDVSFELEPGEILAVIGPSAAGKSSLARVLIGVWPAAKGAVRLDGNELSQWEPDELGQHLGYIPQDVELFGGTVAENIARFGPAGSEEIIEAARMAGVHELIQGLPDGYNTEIGEGGARLSGGQRQRIALARAMLGKPALVVLDEPNASLDTRGEECLLDAIRALKRAGCSVVIITHRSTMISQVDRILVMSNGSVHLFGTREEVMRRLGMPNVVPMQPAARPAAVASPQAGEGEPEPRRNQAWSPARAASRGGPAAQVVEGSQP